MIRRAAITLKTSRVLELYLYLKVLPHGLIDIDRRPWATRLLRAQLVLKCWDSPNLGLELPAFKKGFRQSVFSFSRTSFRPTASDAMASNDDIDGGWDRLHDSSRSRVNSVNDDLEREKGFIDG